MDEQVFLVIYCFQLSKDRSYHLMEVFGFPIGLVVFHCHQPRVLFDQLYVCKTQRQVGPMCLYCPNHRVGVSYVFVYSINVPFIIYKEKINDVCGGGGD